MAELQIVCFGDFQITLDETTPTTAVTDKARALLVYLAIEPQVHERAALTQFLWPGYDEKSARNSLRQTLHLLRQLLRDAEADPPWFLLTRQSIQVNPAASVCVDVVTFLELLRAVAAHPHARLESCRPCLTQLQQAVDLYQGDFLASFSVADSDPFEEWRRITQEQLHIRMLDALTQLADGAEMLGDEEGALQASRRQLVLEPWLEAAHRRIMRLLAGRGQSAAALAQYNRCKQVLAEELGTEPDGETIALYAQIQRGQLPVVRTAPHLPIPPHQPANPATAQLPLPWLASLPPLLGRADELAQIVTLLIQPATRLVTFVGPPGVGKTRLAQAIYEFGLPISDSLTSQQQRLPFDQGIYFIDLASLRNPLLLTDTIAHALTPAEPGLQLTGAGLAAWLREQTVLLILDNFEHVLAAVDLLSQLLHECPHLKVVATSRVPLHLPGEQVVPVHPLPLPDHTPPPSLHIVEQTAAVQLFCRQAAAVVPGFRLTADLAPVVLEICRRLDGLPLAIELAAARCRLLSPPALLERLTAALPTRLELLTGHSQTLPARQQTLRAAIAWSYDLLDAEEQRLFRQMAVFAGGATLAAIETVLGNAQGNEAVTPSRPAQASRSLLDTIESLLDKNLLRQQEPPNPGAENEPRVMMLDTLREYGWERLTAENAENGGDPSPQQRHAEFFLALAERAAPHLHGATQVAWLDRLALEHDNLRAAMDWFVTVGEPVNALRLATALRYFWRIRGHYREGSERLLSLLARPNTTPTDSPTAGVRAHALNAAGYLQWVQGNTAQAQRLLQEALTLGRQVSDAAATAFALRYLALVAAAGEEVAKAQALLEESLSIYRSLALPNETASALMYLGDAALRQRTYDQAEQLYQESADLLRQLGNYVVLPYALRHLGYLALARGKHQEALALCTESLRLNLAAGEQQGSAASLAAVAAVAAAAQCWEQATRLLECVTAWLTAGRVQLLPFDHTYYEQTRQLLQQTHPPTDTGMIRSTAKTLSLHESLVYIEQNLDLTEQPEQHPEPKRGSAEEEETEGESAATPAVSPSPSLPLSPSPSLPLSQSPPLPLSPTPLVGRTQALAEIGYQLQQPGVRLLTLVGPGGMGKTRLAVEAGRQQLAFYPDGVWFVPLAPIREPEALVGAIAAILTITLPGSDPRDLLLQSLRQKQLLLILDNLEHLLAQGSGTVDFVVDLLQAAPGVQILGTSRERLNLREEVLYTVQPLNFSPNATLAEAGASAAVRLFVQSAQRVHADFQLTPANLAAVLRICRLVQAMPLGLELAAANLGGAPLSAIADAIEQSAEVLTVNWHDLPARQRSMRAVFAWSWRLLSAAEQHILRQSAIFRGGFTYSAAQAVTGATIPLLKQLTDKSLLQWQATTTGEGTYAIHEVVRQFAAEELAATGEEAAVATRHSEYYLALLAAEQQRLLYHAPRQAIHAISAELDNIRQAWRWGAGRLSAPLVEQSALTLREFCLLTGLITEGVELFTVAAQARQRHFFADRQAATTDALQRESRLYGLLLGLLGNVLIMAGRHEEALQQATAALQFAKEDTKEDTNPEGVALAYLTQGQALRRQGKSEQAQQLLEQVVELAQTAYDRAHNPTLLLDIARRAYSWLTSIALSNDNYSLARANIARQLDICRRLKKFAGEAMALTDLVDIEKTLGNYALAQQYAEEALAAARKIDFRWAEAACLDQLADIARFQGKYHQAQTMYEQALALYHEMGHLLAEAATSDKLGRLHLEFGDIDRAQTHIGQAFQLLRILDMPARETCAVTLSRAWLHYLCDQPEAALVAAEEGQQMAGQLDGGAGQAAASILVGLIRERLQQADAAAAAYQAALNTYVALGQHHQTVEPRAGLARLALATGDASRAQAEVEAVLPILLEQPRAGINSPYFTYVTCYRVLVALRDPRAVTLLQQGYALLQQDAAGLNEESRARFLTGVAVHRELVAAYEGMQETGDTRYETGDTRLERETGDGVTSLSSVSPSPVSPSPASLAALRDWTEMPVIDFFTGRAAEVAQVTTWLVPSDSSAQPAQLVSIVGIGGIGKTTLAAAVTKAVAVHFPVVIWRSLLNAPPLRELLSDWLQILSRQTLIALPESLDEQMRLLLTYLQQERCLLVLDNVESIFATENTQGRAGVTRPGYEAYDQLLQRLGSSDHQSCLLLTSREQPHALMRLGRQAQSATGRVQLLLLAGLDQPAGQALLVSNGLHTSTAASAELIANYSGNPLALQIVATTIADFFGGDVAAFQQEQGTLFDGMRLMLDQQFARLSPLEQEILVWLAIEREAITISTLRSNLVHSVATAPLLEALQALKNRALLDKRDAGFTLQNVIIEYTTAYLVEQVFREIIDDRMTATADHAVIRSSSHPVTLSFLNRFALIKAQSKEYIRQSQERLILQPIGERLRKQLGDQPLTEWLNRILGNLRLNTRERAEPLPGYAAGNLLNLLLHLRVDITGYDFSHLAVWQANLRDKAAQELNLTHADLRGACFTDLFTHILALAYHPHHPWIGGGDRAGTIYRWHADNGHLLATYQGHKRCIYDLAFSPDGHLLASASEDGTVRIWETESGQVRHLLDGHHTFVNSVAFSADGQWLASGGDDRAVCLWHVQSGQLLHRLLGHTDRICDVAFPPLSARAPVDQPVQAGPLTNDTSKLLASCSDDHTVRLWDGVSGQLLQCLVGHDGHVEELAFSAAPTGHPRWLASGSDDGTVCIWDVATGQIRHRLPAYTSATNTVAFHPTADILASGGDSLVRLWDAATGESLHLLPGHGFWITDLAFSPDGQTLVSSSEDGTVRMWDVPSGHPLQILAGINNWVCDLAFEDAGNLTVSVIKGQQVSLWDGHSGVTRRQLHGHTKSVIVADFSPDGRRLLSGGEDTYVYFWDVASGNALATLPGHPRQVTAVAASHDGQWAATGALDHVVRLWQIGSAQQVYADQGTLVYTLSGHSGRIHTLTFAPDDMLLASAGEHALCLWDVRRGLLLHQMTDYPLPFEVLAFSPDGTLLAAGSEDHNIYLWEVAGGSLRAVLHGHRGTVFALAFHPDGKTLVSGSGDSCVILWDVERGTLLQQLTGHDSWVTVVDFYPDGDQIVTGSADGAVKRWRLPEGRCLETYYAKGAYAGMKITGVTGINAAQRAALKALGAVEE